MSRLSTLPAPLQSLLAGVERLHYAVEVDERLQYLSHPSHVHERYLRDKMHHELGHKAMEKATVTTQFDIRRCTVRTEATVYVFSEAELAVLLARAHAAR